MLRACEICKYLGFFFFFKFMRELHQSCQPRPLCTFLISSPLLHKQNSTSPLALDHLELVSVAGF